MRKTTVLSQQEANIVCGGQPQHSGPVTVTIPVSVPVGPATVSPMIVVRPVDPPKIPEIIGGGISVTIPW